MILRSWLEILTTISLCEEVLLTMPINVKCRIYLMFTSSKGVVHIYITFQLL